MWRPKHKTNQNQIIRVLNFSIKSTKIPKNINRSQGENCICKDFNDKIPCLPLVTLRNITESLFASNTIPKTNLTAAEVISLKENCEVFKNLQGLIVTQKPYRYNDI